MPGLIAYGVYIPDHRLKRFRDRDGAGRRRRQGHQSRGRLSTRTPRRWPSRRPGRRWPACRPAWRRNGCCSPPPARRTWTRPTPTSIHAALRLDPGALAVDVIGSVRSGVGALVLAAESPVPTLAVLSDVRTGLPGGADERDGGDAAAAFVFGRRTRRWRRSRRGHRHRGVPRPVAPARERRRPRVWEERFGEHAYLPLADAAFTDALKQAGHHSRRGRRAGGGGHPRPGGQGLRCRRGRGPGSR